jgi:hypothetical protein
MSCGGSSIAHFSTISKCPENQLIITKECIPISQACGSTNVPYFVNPVGARFNGLVQINNTSTNCAMEVVVFDAVDPTLGTHYNVAAGAGFKVAVQNLTRITISCTAATGLSALCTGQLILELQECVTC